MTEKKENNLGKSKAKVQENKPPKMVEVDFGKFKTKNMENQEKKQIQFNLDHELYNNLEAKAKAAQMDLDQYILDLIQKDNKLIMIYLNENDILLLRQILIDKIKTLKVLNQKPELIQVMKMIQNITQQHQTPKICLMCQKPIEINDLEVKFGSDGPKFYHTSCTEMNDLLDLAEKENEKNLLVDPK